MSKDTLTIHLDPEDIQALEKLAGYYGSNAATMVGMLAKRAINLGKFDLDYPDPILPSLPNYERLTPRNFTDMVSDDSGDYSTDELLKKLGL